MKKINQLNQNPKTKIFGQHQTATAVSCNGARSEKQEAAASLANAKESSFYNQSTEKLNQRSIV